MSENSFGASPLISIFRAFEIYMYRKLFPLILILFCGYAASAQHSDVGAWYMYFGNSKLNERLNWHHEIQYRNFNAVGRLEQLMLRTGIGYDLAENNNNLLLGYGYITSKPFNNSGIKTTTREHRLFQQFITRHSMGRVNVQHRYRMEERFLQDIFRGRLRYFLALNIPFNNKTMAPKSVYGSVYNEIFLSLHNPTFDRNRVYGALGYVLNKDVRIEAGYMEQVYQAGSRGQAQVAIFNNLSFIKKMPEQPHSPGTD